MALLRPVRTIAGRPIAWWPICEPLWSEAKRCAAGTPGLMRLRTRIRPSSEYHHVHVVQGVRPGRDAKPARQVQTAEREPGDRPVRERRELQRIAVLSYIV